MATEYPARVTMSGAELAQVKADAGQAAIEAYIAEQQRLAAERAAEEAKAKQEAAIRAQMDQHRAIGTHYDAQAEASAPFQLSPTAGSLSAGERLPLRLLEALDNLGFLTSEQRERARRSAHAVEQIGTLKKSGDAAGVASLVLPMVRATNGNGNGKKR